MKRTHRVNVTFTYTTSQLIEVEGRIENDEVWADIEEQAKSCTKDELEDGNIFYEDMEVEYVGEEKC